MRGLLAFLFGGAAVVAASSMAKKNSKSKLVYERLPDGSAGFYRAKEADEMAKGGGIQKVWYKREGKKDYYFDQDAIWYQQNGVYKKGDDGLEYSTKEQINKVYKRKSGMDLINSFRKNRDYRMIDERFSKDVLYYIAFLDLSDGTTVSFSSGDLYAKGGGVGKGKSLLNKFSKEKPNIILVMIADDVSSDFMRKKFDETIVWDKLSDTEKEKYNQEYKKNKDEFEGYLMNEFVKEYYSDDSIKNKCKGESRKTIDSIKSVMVSIAKKYPRDKYAKGGGVKKLKYGGDPEDSLFLELYVNVTYVINEDGEKATKKGWITVNDVYSDDEMYDEIKSELGIELEDISDVEILKENVV
jgi:hypothetical protein